jgi:hypothetical protein
MKQRCTNPNTPFFKNYGGRGIKVCEEWLSSFEAFAHDMGMPPSDEYTLDRINNDGDYTPENCRWANQTQQHENGSRSINITAFGETKPAKTWAKNLGINYQKITYAYRSKGLEAATAIVEAGAHP